MISINPFTEISAFIPAIVMQVYVVAMFLLVIGATLFDVVHKKSAKYFFNNVEFSIIPLWTTDTFSDECGCALTLFGKPCVAHLT